MATVHVTECSVLLFIDPGVDDVMGLHETPLVSLSECQISTSEDNHRDNHKDGLVVPVLL
jgi:hypothetical protein